MFRVTLLRIAGAAETHEEALEPERGWPVRLDAKDDPEGEVSTLGSIVAFNTRDSSGWMPPNSAFFDSRSASFRSSFWSSSVSSVAR
jgi:hypothetical protein